MELQNVFFSGCIWFNFFFFQTLNLNAEVIRVTAVDADATSQNNRVTYSIVNTFKISWKASESMCFLSNVQVYLLVTSVLAENKALH